jgi:hypothetical protein
MPTLMTKTRTDAGAERESNLRRGSWRPPPPGDAARRHETGSEIPAQPTVAPPIAWDFGKLAVFEPGAPRPVYAKLLVGALDDPQEIEADRGADRLLHGAPAPTPLGHSAAHAGAPRRDANEAPAIVHETLRTPGEPLDASTRAFFETRLGIDLSAVRVRTDARAAASARAIGARAYTVGSDLVFDSGQYAPSTIGGRRILAHELHHVVQRRSPSVQPRVQRQPPDAKATPDHPVADAAGSVSVSVGKTMTAEAGLRQVYEQSARSITDQALKMAAEGGNTPEAIEQAARFAANARNELKVLIRAKGSVITKALAEARNIKKYGDKVGPTFDELIREGKTPLDLIGSAGKANERVTRTAMRMKLAGRFLIAIDLAIVTWEVIEAPEGTRLRTAVGGAGGIAGAWAGGELGAIGGAKIGGAIGTFIEPGGGTALGGAIGGVIGGLAGAITGGFYGKKGAEKAYDIVADINAPNIDVDINRIDTAQDAVIRAAAKK